MLPLTHVLFFSTHGTTSGHFYMRSHEVLLHWLASTCHIQMYYICVMFSCMLDICSFFSLFPSPKIGFTQVQGLFPLTITIHWGVIYSSQACRFKTPAVVSSLYSSMLHFCFRVIGSSFCTEQLLVISTY